MNNNHGIWIIDRNHMIRYLPLTRRQGWRRRIIAAIVAWLREHYRVEDW